MGHIDSKLTPRLGQESPWVSEYTSPPHAARALDEERVMAENGFHATLTLERRRAERSRKPFVLMLLDATGENGTAGATLRRAAEIVGASKRDTDLIGWYRFAAVLGVIFTEVSTVGERPITEILREKFEMALIKRLGPDRAARIGISMHLFPESWDKDDSNWTADPRLYPDVKKKETRKRFPLALKRGIDVAGSALLLLVLSPIFALVAALIKLTSKGPVIFEQERLGQFGARFKCLKFRTMYANNDPKIHQDYVQQFIAGKNGRDHDHSEGSDKPVFKLVGDPRVTAIGSFLRKTSLDELPQFWNVLRGEMSLVGPRPPVPYEFEVYDIWHRSRILEVKPGITGLWQVSGRNRIRFDEMVRLDLHYCRHWSLWLDLKILFATPLAVFTGGGAC